MKLIQGFKRKEFFYFKNESKNLSTLYFDLFLSTCHKFSSKDLPGVYTTLRLKVKNYSKIKEIPISIPRVYIILLSYFNFVLGIEYI